MGQDEDLERLMGHLGEFGKYQLFQFCLHLLAGMTAGLHMLSIVTVAAVPDHRCAIPTEGENGTRIYNDTYFGRDKEDLRRYIPPRPQGEGLDSCHLINPDNNITQTCDHWVYDTQYYKSSRGMEWNFVCGDRWKGSMAQSSYMLGVFAGAISLGSMADKFGRKIVLYLSAVLQLIIGIGVAFVNEYYLYLAVTFAYGMFGSAGSYNSAFVLTMEIVGASKRTVCGLTFPVMFALGVVLVAFWGSVVPDRMWLQVVYGAHSAVLIFHWWLMDESPRWLWSQGRISEAVAIVERGVKMNGGEPIDKAHYVSRGKVTSAAEEQSYGVLDMFKTPRLRMKSLNCCLNMFANSLVYYGLSLNAGNLAGNPYFVLGILGLIEIPSYALTALLMDRAGRRFLSVTFMLIGGSAGIVSAFTPKGSALTLSIVFLGKFCISGSFAIIFNYSAELFPTVIRNTGLGIGSMCARLSAAMTPLITLLDSFDPRVPTVVFAMVALVSGALTMLLPETMNQPMPESLEDGELFGQGDTCCTTGCLGTKRKGTAVPLSELD